MRTRPQISRATILLAAGVTVAALALAACSNGSYESAQRRPVAELKIEHVHDTALFSVLAVFPLDSATALVMNHREATVDRLNILEGSVYPIAVKGSGPSELRYPVAFAPTQGLAMPRILDLGRRRLIAVESTQKDIPLPLSVDARVDIVPLLTQIPLAATATTDRVFLFKPDSALFYPRSFRRAMVISWSANTAVDTVTRLSPVESTIPVTATYLSDHPLACTSRSGSLFILDPVQRRIREHISGAETRSVTVDTLLVQPNGSKLPRDEQLMFVRHLTIRSLIGSGMAPLEATVDSIMNDPSNADAVGVFVGDVRPLAAALVCDARGEYVMLEQFRISEPGVGHSGEWVRIALDSASAPVRFNVPANVRVLAADGEWLWGVRRNEDDLEQLVRLRMLEQLQR